MKNIEKVIIPVIIIVIVTMLGIYYISKEYEKQQAQKRAEQIKEETLAEQEENLADSDDLVYQSIAMLVGKNEDEHKLKFISVDNDKLFELEYTTRTPILGRHGNSLTLAEIPLGEILDVSYSIHSKDLIELKVSNEAWTFTDVVKFEIDENEGKMMIAGSTYKLPKTAIVSYRDKLATFMDVTNVDTLIVKGYGRKVCSVIVDRGHGYVRLVNDSYFEGGWVEIGQDIIKKVTEEMLIPVPEGNYHVRLTNKGYAAEQDVTIERDKESVIDLADVDIKEVAIGHVEFSIVPDYAQLSIDGVMTEFEERVPLEFGIHRIHVELAGYKSVDTNIRISDQYANVDIVLEEDGEDTKSTTGRTTPTPTPTPTPEAPTPTPVQTTQTSTDNIIPTLTHPNTTPTVIPSTSKTTASTTSSSTDGATSVISNTRKMYVESPEGAEVFVDGIYVGISPISFIKPESGSHVVTLSKNGYVTKSYTISVAGDDRDVTLSFSELIAQ